MSLPIAITCGDPAGVGPEIIAQLLKDNPAWQKDVCIVGPGSWLGGCNFLHATPVGDAGYTAHPGLPDEAGAEVARQALEEAAYGCRQGRYRAVVTGPINKAWMNKVGWGYPGHTEFFADRWYGQPSMAFAGGKMCVVLATWHIPFSEVPQNLNHETLSRAVKNADFLVQKLGKAEVPRIGVCGLNPHAGEGGLLGYEEQGVLDPILDALRADYPGLSSCLPADTLFWRHLQGEFDVVIALYHDQGLAPLKSVDFASAANLTLGLPFVRTSPDHGTAFDIAGTGKAGTASFANALSIAQKLS